MQIITDSEDVLINWGRWAGSNPFSSLCYPSIEPYRKMYALAESRRPAPNEQSAIIADHLLAQLIVRMPEVGVVTALYFMTNMSCVTLSEFINTKRPQEKISKTRVNDCVSIGISWFDGAYTGIDLVA
jgi:hypothetical protein